MDVNPQGALCTMHYACMMYRMCVHAWGVICYLSGIHSSQGLGEDAKLCGPDDGRERAVLHELQDDVQVRARLEGAQVLDDVAVVQRLEQLDLAHHGLKVIRGDAPQRDPAQGDLLDSDLRNAPSRVVAAGQFVHLGFRGVS
jgi:hypothetical protein